MRRPAEPDHCDSGSSPLSELIYRRGETRCAVSPTALLDTPDARRSAVAAGAGTHVGGRGDSRRPTGGYVGVRLSAAHALEYGVGGALTVGAYRRSLRDGHRHRETRDRGRTAPLGPSGGDTGRAVVSGA